eukprot:3861932-Rhodomonas_salina.1
MDTSTLDDQDHSSSSNWKLHSARKIQLEQQTQSCPTSSLLSIAQWVFDTEALKGLRKLHWQKLPFNQLVQRVLYDQLEAVVPHKDLRMMFLHCILQVDLPVRAKAGQI